MKTKIIILTLLLVLFETATAQKYFIVTSYNRYDHQDRKPGVSRIDGVDYDNTLLITFKLVSDLGKRLLTFAHCNIEKRYDGTRMPWDQMEILEKPVSFLDSIETIDVYELYRHTSYEYMRLKIYLPLYHNIEEIDANKMYVIDRNDIKDGKIKLIQVCVM